MLETNSGSELLRTVRLVAQLRMLWLLIRGLLATLSLMVNTVFMMGLVLFVYSCVAVELIAKDEELLSMEGYELYADRWESFYSIMITLFQIVWLDDASRIYYPLVKERWFLLLYFLSFIMMVSVALMNLLTAIVVEGSFEQARNDREVASQSKKRLMTQVLPRIWNLIKVIDEDGSGQIEYDEFRNLVAELRRFQEAAADDVLRVFLAFDRDRSRSIDVRELVSASSLLPTPPALLAHPELGGSKPRSAVHLEDRGQGGLARGQVR